MDYESKYKKIQPYTNENHMRMNTIIAGGSNYYGSSYTPNKNDGTGSIRMFRIFIIK
jgi:hypothetical protein